MVQLLVSQVPDLDCDAVITYMHTMLVVMFRAGVTKRAQQAVIGMVYVNDGESDISNMKPSAAPVTITLPIGQAAQLAERANLGSQEQWPAYERNCLTAGKKRIKSVGMIHPVKSDPGSSIGSPMQNDSKPKSRRP